MIEQRPYQSKVLDDFKATVEQGTHRLILVAPTGSGKTVMASGIIRQAVDGHKTVMVLAHRIEIISQTSRKLHENGIAHGIIQAGMDRLQRPQARVQVASIQTLHARAIRSDHMKLPPADLLIIDEAHHCRANTYQKIIAAYPGDFVWPDGHTLPR
jgi:DNA repair protein RadD